MAVATRNFYSNNSGFANQIIGTPGIKTDDDDYIEQTAKQIEALITDVDVGKKYNVELRYADNRLVELVIITEINDEY